jgi:hypothetical protein
MLGWDWYGFDRKRIGTHYVGQMFVDPVVYACEVVHSGASEVENGDALFFMLGWDHCGFNEKHAETRYAELVFLLPVLSVGHVSLGIETSTHFFHAQVGPVRFP